MQTEAKKENKIKGKKLWLKVVGVLFALFIVYSIGESAAKVELEEEKVSYDQLVEKIEDKEKEMEEKENEVEKIELDIGSIQNEYDKNKAKLEEAMKVVAEKDSVQKEIDKLTLDISQKQEKTKKLDTEIKDKKDELASIQGTIKEKKDAPITLPAGFFTVGKDLPAGRYKAVPNGGGGNFFVNSGMKVNIMLGNGEFYEDEYVFYADEGDEIELTLSAKFIPVE
ncbi:hypothetical protein M3182_16545 [Mesobacillus maritimus]|uniref:coiled-coil domain-containing protein n=1 Tax=Mesobacillus maritimus TaxID=1643336 RepID=UPI00203C2009|nr:hypothetical protein [Mesobacillus maritimus]MCM3587348.1 hypothetical protein [Mesobacillus maritimus]